MDTRLEWLQQREIGGGVVEGRLERQQGGCPGFLR